VSAAFAPICVSNISLKGIGSVNFPTAPQPGQTLFSRVSGAASSLFFKWSTRVRVLHFLHSEIKSANLSAWPDAFQISGCISIEQSSPTTSSRSWTAAFHHAFLTLFFNSTPSGP